MRLCKSYRVNPQSECNEPAHRSMLMADKCHPERSVTESKDLKHLACHPALVAGSPYAECHSERTLERSGRGSEESRAKNG